MALRNSGGVSAELRERVVNKAREMNYAPAVAARLLRGKHTGQLGLYLPFEISDIEHSSGFTMPIITHFVSLCEINRYSYHIELSGCRGEFAAPTQLTGRLVDGVLLVGRQQPELMDWLQQHPEYKWVSVIEREQYCVLSANRSGIYRAVEHLAALGHRQIAFMHCNLEYDVHSAALDGYRLAVADFDLATYDYLCRDVDLSQGRESFQPLGTWLDYLLAPERCPTAVVCNDQRIAYMLMLRAAGRGMSIPDDLSVIAYGSKAGAMQMYPFLTTVEADFQSIMEKAIQMLLRRIAGQPLEEEQVAVDARLVKRDSVAAPRRK